jgi:hypothetical protein
LLFQDGYRFKEALGNLSREYEHNPITAIVDWVAIAKKSCSVSVIMRRPRPRKALSANVFFAEIQEVVLWRGQTNLIQAAYGKPAPWVLASPIRCT